MARVFVEQSACDGCGACVAVCSFDAISVEHGHAIVDAAECTGCSACLGECPAGAISQEEEMFVRPGWERPAHGFWVLAETVDGSVTGATLELLTIARRLCDDPVNDVCAVLVGEENASLAELLGGFGAGRVFVVGVDRGAESDESSVAAAVACLARDRAPAVLLVGGTEFGRTVAPRIAALLGTGLTADCTALEIDPTSHLLHQIRPAFGGDVLARVICPRHRPQMATVRPGVFKAVPAPHAQPPEVTRFSSGVGPDARLRSLERRRLGLCAPGLEDADIIVAGGMGLGSAGGFHLVERLAESLGGAVACSRAVVEAGWAPPEWQVGQTGVCVSPRLYVALGISGAVQHCVGMQGSDFIVAINEDPSARMLQVADVGIVGRVEEVVPELIRAIEGGALGGGRPETVCRA